MGADRVIAIDHFPTIGWSLRRQFGAETINFEQI